MLYWESMILEADGLQPPKIGGNQRKLIGGQLWIAGAAIW